MRNNIKIIVIVLIIVIIGGLCREKDVPYSSTYTKETRETSNSYEYISTIRPD